eukprot:scaffold1532_cov120-Isochrysis_galbana.AAC.3
MSGVKPKWLDALTSAPVRSKALTSSRRPLEAAMCSDCSAESFSVNHTAGTISGGSDAATVAALPNEKPLAAGAAEAGAPKVAEPAPAAGVELPYAAAGAVRNLHKSGKGLSQMAAGALTAGAGAPKVAAGALTAGPGAPKVAAGALTAGAGALKIAAAALTAGAGAPKVAAGALTAGSGLGAPLNAGAGAPGSPATTAAAPSAGTGVMLATSAAPASGVDVGVGAHAPTPGDHMSDIGTRPTWALCRTARQIRLFLALTEASPTERCLHSVVFLGRP